VTGETTVRIEVACQCGRFAGDRPVPFTCACGIEYVAQMVLDGPPVTVQFPTKHSVITSLEEV
jgi:hypothetical protein